MIFHLTLVFCRVIGLIEKCVEDDGRARRLIAIVASFALIAMTVLRTLPLGQ